MVSFHEPSPPPPWPISSGLAFEGQNYPQTQYAFRSGLRRRWLHRSHLRKLTCALNLCSYGKVRPQCVIPAELGYLWVHSIACSAPDCEGPCLYALSRLPPCHIAKVGSQVRWIMKVWVRFDPILMQRPLSWGKQLKLAHLGGTYWICAPLPVYGNDKVLSCYETSIFDIP